MILKYQLSLPNMRVFRLNISLVLSLFEQIKLRWAVKYLHSHPKNVFLQVPQATPKPAGNFWNNKNIMTNS